MRLNQFIVPAAVYLSSYRSASLSIRSISANLVDKMTLHGHGSFNLHFPVYKVKQLVFIVHL